MTEQKSKIKEGISAPLFTAKNQDGVEFSLESRKGQGWTVLFFYPKASTPLCTQQACSYRDNTKALDELNAKAYGISADSVERIAKFKKDNHLNFDLLSDPKLQIIESYDVKYPLLLKVARRCTIIIDPDLVIKKIYKDVDAVDDAPTVIKELKKLQE